ncbi:low molecular weight protein tyrosine phosphatase family protein [Luteolibacter luteus]|uniref:Phosphotyrosine protein phosphatase n=1 Tax=Luteolibacter luteus TaxID=2728835 RepID=A0A858RI44_9BACT|nr:low molecular weight protein tyrosine phosphatase family protein [Luteolibacter luteus]QJE96567.1 phosphotyrosine protein phosphatase [Luteolibacter luteus]
MSKRLLFLCSRNRLRSPTAEAVFAGYPGIETDSAGLAPDAELRLTAEQVEWADIILVMERVHQQRLKKGFGKLLGGKKVAVLDIPDDYQFMEPALVELLKSKCGPFLS